MRAGVFLYRDYETVQVSGDANQEIAVVRCAGKNLAAPRPLNKHQLEASAGRQLDPQATFLVAIALIDAATDQQLFAPQYDELHGDFLPVECLEIGFVRCHAAQRGMVSLGRASSQFL